MFLDKRYLFSFVSTGVEALLGHSDRSQPKEETNTQKGDIPGPPEVIQYRGLPTTAPPFTEATRPEGPVFSLTSSILPPPQSRNACWVD